jgi:hypothetical protein
MQSHASNHAHGMNLDALLAELSPEPVQDNKASSSNATANAAASASSEAALHNAAANSTDSTAHAVDQHASQQLANHIEDLLRQHQHHTA